jgi:hypothetical protein
VQKLSTWCVFDVTGKRVELAAILHVTTWFVLSWQLLRALIKTFAFEQYCTATVVVSNSASTKAFNPPNQQTAILALSEYPWRIGPENLEILCSYSLGRSLETHNTETLGQNFNPM